MTKLQYDFDNKHRDVLDWLTQQQGSCTLTKAHSLAVNFLFLTASAMNVGELPKFPIYCLENEPTEDQPETTSVNIVNSIFLEYFKGNFSSEVFSGDEIQYVNLYNSLELTGENYRFMTSGNVLESLKQKIEKLTEWSGEKSRRVVSLDALLSHNLHFTLLRRGYNFAYK